MANLNKVFLMGNLTRDPELRYSTSGMAVCKLGLATNRSYRDKSTSELVEETTFVDITVFDKTAENCGQYLVKGRPVLVEGRLKFEQWETEGEGQKRSKLVVIANNVQFLSNKKSDDEPQPESAIPGEDAQSIPF